MRRFENQLDDFPRVEIPPDELGIRFVFFERHDGEVRVRHDGVADRGDTFQEIKGVGGGGAGEGLDEDDAGGGLRTGGVETLDADWHCVARVVAFFFVRDGVWGKLEVLEWKCFGDTLF